MFSADLAFFCLFSFLFIYFSSLVCVSADLGSIYCQYYANMNIQCELVSLPFHRQLNYLLSALNAIAHGMGDPTTLAGLKHLFVGTVYCHHHYLCYSAAAAFVINLFNPSAEFSHLILAFKDILNILCYQIY